MRPSGAPGGPAGLVDGVAATRAWEGRPWGVEGPGTPARGSVLVFGGAPA